VSSVAGGKLADIAAADPELAPFAELLGIALAAAREDVWGQTLDGVAERLGAGEPALHGSSLVLPLGAAEALWERLAGRLPPPGPFQSRWDRGLLGALRLEGSDDGAAGAVSQLMLVPGLMAVGRACAPVVAESGWGNGICPVCAAWPALAESRGLERLRMLRCGRCGSQWKLPWQLCPFCAGVDYASLSYLYSDELGEARRVFTCGRCHGYLKTLATLAAVDPLAVPVEDLATLQLDMAALDAGFQRPSAAGFDLQVELSWTN
jgi:hypothetical protein